MTVWWTKLGGQASTLALANDTSSLVSDASGTSGGATPAGPALQAMNADCAGLSHDLGNAAPEPLDTPSAQAWESLVETLQNTVPHCEDLVAGQGLDELSDMTSLLDSANAELASLDARLQALGVTTGT